VSIGLPVYDGEKYLRQALDSLLAQSFEDFELIIADNASTDATQAICESYAARDQRIRYYRNDSNIGAAPNFNRVFDLATGPYFRWAAHDDICSPRVLEKCVEVLDRDASVVLSHPRAVAIDENGQVIDNYMEKYDSLKNADSRVAQARFYDFTNRRHACFQVFGLIRTAALAETPRIGSYTGSDRVLLAELSLKGRIVEIAEPLYVRRHKEQYCALESTETRVNWFDPSAKVDGNLAHYRTLREYARVIQRSGLNWKTRLPCYGVLARWALRKRNRLQAELVYALKKKRKADMSNRVVDGAHSEK
jgi:glycosyltransferase involved in cell wall biosynthesis